MESKKIDGIIKVNKQNIQESRKIVLNSIEEELEKQKKEDLRNDKLSKKVDGIFSVLKKSKEKKDNNYDDKVIDKSQKKLSLDSVSKKPEKVFKNIKQSEPKDEKKVIIKKNKEDDDIKINSKKRNEWKKEVENVLQIEDEDIEKDEQQPQPQPQQRIKDSVNQENSKRETVGIFLKIGNLFSEKITKLKEKKLERNKRKKKKYNEEKIEIIKKRAEEEKQREKESKNEKEKEIKEKEEYLIKKEEKENRKVQKKEEKENRKVQKKEEKENRKVQKKEEKENRKVQKKEEKENRKKLKELKKLEKRKKKAKEKDKIRNAKEKLKEEKILKKEESRKKEAKEEKEKIQNELDEKKEQALKEKKLALLKEKERKIKEKREQEKEAKKIAEINEREIYFKKKKKEKKLKRDETFKNLNDLVKNLSRTGKEKFLYISGKVLSLIFIFFMVCIFSYTSFAFIILKLNVDNNITRFASRYIFVPAFISKDGAVEYYKYHDFINTTKDESNSDIIQVDINAKLVFTREFIFHKLLNSHKLPDDNYRNLDESSKEEINKKLLMDVEINQVPLNRIKKLKDLIADNNDFVSIASKYGDKTGSIIINNENKEKFSYYDKVELLNKGDISNIIFTSDGYYIFSLFEKNNEYIELYYVLIYGKNLEDYIEEEIEGYKLWSFID